MGAWLVGVLGSCERGLYLPSYLNRGRAEQRGAERCRAEQRAMDDGREARERRKEA